MKRAKQPLSHTDRQKRSDGQTNRGMVTCRWRGMRERIARIANPLSSSPPPPSFFLPFLAKVKRKEEASKQEGKTICCLPRILILLNHHKSPALFIRSLTLRPFSPFLLSFFPLEKILLSVPLSLTARRQGRSTILEFSLPDSSSSCFAFHGLRLLIPTSITIPDSWEEEGEECTRNRHHLCREREEEKERRRVGAAERMEHHVFAPLNDLVMNSEITHSHPPQTTCGTGNLEGGTIIACKRNRSLLPAACFIRVLLPSIFMSRNYDERLIFSQSHTASYYGSRERETRALPGIQVLHNASPGTREGHCAFISPSARQTTHTHTTQLPLNQPLTHLLGE